MSLCFGLVPLSNEQVGTQTEVLMYPTAESLEAEGRSHKPTSCLLAEPPLRPKAWTLLYL